MEMKWNPIENGNLEGLESGKAYLFTWEYARTNRPFYDVSVGFVSEERDEVIMYRTCEAVLAVECKAWMEVPEPYKPTPDKCFKCNHGHLQHDEDSDNWLECELLQRAVPPWGKPEDCPLNR